MVSNAEDRSIKRHRTFSADEKARILAEHEAAASPLERAALARREGVYGSLLSNWRKELAQAKPSKRGRPANRLATENARYVSSPRWNPTDLMPCARLSKATL